MVTEVILLLFCYNMKTCKMVRKVIIINNLLFRQGNYNQLLSHHCGGFKTISQFSRDMCPPACVR